MINFLLYGAAALIWGSTWLAIKLQLTQVPPILSVSYRFCLASLILLAFCRLTGPAGVLPIRTQLLLQLPVHCLYDQRAGRGGLLHDPDVEYL